MSTSRMNRINSHLFAKLENHQSRLLWTKYARRDGIAQREGSRYHFMACAKNRENIKLYTFFFATNCVWMWSGTAKRYRTHHISIQSRTHADGTIHLFSATFCVSFRFLLILFPINEHLFGVWAWIYGRRAWMPTISRIRNLFSSRANKEAWCEPNSHMRRNKKKWNNCRCLCEVVNKLPTMILFGERVCVYVTNYSKTQTCGKTKKKSIRIECGTEL